MWGDDLQIEILDLFREAQFIHHAWSDRIHTFSEHVAKERARKTAYMLRPDVIARIKQRRKKDAEYDARVRMNGAGRTQRYRDKNRASLNQAARERYANDPAYREMLKAKARERSRRRYARQASA